MPTRHSMEPSSESAGITGDNVLTTIANSVRESTETPSEVQESFSTSSVNNQMQTNNSNNQFRIQDSNTETNANRSSDDERTTEIDMTYTQDNENDSALSVTPAKLSTFSRDEFPNTFQYFKDKDYPEVVGTQKIQMIN